jgi:hypothetical protein
MPNHRGTRHHAHSVPIPFMFIDRQKLVLMIDDDHLVIGSLRPALPARAVHENDGVLNSIVNLRPKACTIFPTIVSTTNKVVGSGTRGRGLAGIVLFSRNRNRSSISVNSSLASRERLGFDV